MSYFITIKSIKNSAGKTINIIDAALKNNFIPFSPGHPSTSK
jgi:hypothetical protein